MSERSKVVRTVFGGADVKARPLLHALEDEVHAVGVVPDHAALPGQDMVFLAHTLLGPFDSALARAGKIRCSPT